METEGMNRTGKNGRVMIEMEGGMRVASWGKNAWMNVSMILSTL